MIQRESAQLLFTKLYFIFANDTTTIRGRRTGSSEQDRGTFVPDIEIRDADGKLLQTYTIIVAEYGSLITDDDLYEMAKNNFIEDELVGENKLDELTFRLAE